MKKSTFLMLVAIFLFIGNVKAQNERKPNIRGDFQRCDIYNGWKIWTATYSFYNNGTIIYQFDHHREDRHKYKSGTYYIENTGRSYDTVYIRWSDGSTDKGTLYYPSQYSSRRTTYFEINSSNYKLQ